MQPTPLSRPIVDRQSSFAEFPDKNEDSSSGVSWAAVFAGAAVAAALSLSLLALGAGLGLSSISPWSNAGASSLTVTRAAIVWLLVMQALAMSMGGYLSGRLRTKWTAIHSDEVYFRDTAHGFLVWAVAIVIAASLLATAAVSMAGGTTRATTLARESQPSGGEASGPGINNYFVDRLFRPEQPTAQATDPTEHAEAGRILANAVLQPRMPEADRSYLAQQVAAKTGLSQAEAEKRVSEADSGVRQALDSARKAGARLSIWTFIALLIGAFCASLSATIGGRQRDHMKPV